MELTENKVRGDVQWVLRTDVEALVLRFYGTKTFHDKRGQRQYCKICAKAGTLARIMALRAQREAQIWEPVPGSRGRLVKRKTEHLHPGDQQSSTWARYLDYHEDHYLYKPEDFKGGYHLQFYSVEDVD